MQTDTQRAREALQYIPADLPRDEWVKAGMAAKAAGVSFDEFNDWSATAGNYQERDARDAWKSFTNGGIGPGTLFHMAGKHGYQASNEPPIKQTPAKRPSKDVMAVWARLEPATTQHPYIAKKRAAGAPLDGLRVVPAGDSLTIARQTVAGYLAVPAYRDGKLQSIQFIPGDGQKLNMPGCSMAGASFIVGDGAPRYLVEGIGQAWAIWQATGDAAAVCFGWGNVARIAQEHPDAVLVPDAGKEADAARISQELGCKVATMPEGSPSNFDAWDYGQQEGPDALALLLEAAKGPRPLLLPVSVADVLTRPSPPARFVWSGYTPRGVVTMLGAHGGTGKSTIALMLGVAVATGRPLFGVATERAPVLFASFEDAGSTVRHRLAGICKAWDINPAELDSLHIVDGTENPELFEADNRGPGQTTAAYSALQALATEAGAGLVIVDNASDVYGADEIQRRQVRAFIRALAAIAKQCDAAMLLLAHVDKGTSRARKAEGGEGYSGSTAWHNSVRSRLFMSRAEDGTLTLEHQKSNFAAMREPLTLEWPKDGLPCVLESLSPVVQQLTDRGDTKALLRLIHEFTERGEQVSTATTGPAAFTSVLRGERGYPKRKAREVAALAREAERSQYLERANHRTENRKTREVWRVTPEGEAFAELRSAPIAPIAPIDEFKESAQPARIGGEVRAPISARGCGGIGARNGTGAIGADEEAADCWGEKGAGAIGAEPADAGAVQTTGAEGSAE